MDSPRGTLRSIFILACLFSDMARSLKNEENPSDFKALEILRRQKDSTQVKEILPVEVNIGGLVNSFNEQIQKLGDHVTRLDNQLQIIKGNEERHLESYKAELERSRNKSQLLEEAQNSFKEEIYRLKNESTAIKAENERLKMKLEATTHEGTTSRPKTNGLTWSYILGSCIDSSDQDGWILLQERNVQATSKYTVDKIYTYEKNYTTNIFSWMKWKDYKAGFEDPDLGYWYGLQKMHEKTLSGRWKVALVYRCGENDRCAVLNDFKIDGENEKFKLHVGTKVSQKGWYGGNLEVYNNMKFTTSDNDNDNRNFNCATYGDVAGGWWYDGCTINDICPNCNRLDAGCTYTFMAMKRI